MMENSLVTLFENQLSESPYAIALDDGNSAFTFVRLAEMSYDMARELGSIGVAEETVVALNLPVGPRLIAGMLAAGHLGAAFLALDQHDPEFRRDQFLSIARPAAIVMDDRILVPEAAPQLLSSRLPRCSSAAAYLSYTSGSSGEPKAVVNEQHSIANYIVSAIEEYGLVPGDRQLQFSSVAFDIALEEVFTCLCSGATLVLRGHDFVYDGIEAFLHLVRERRISILNFPTSVWNQFGIALRQAPEVRLPPLVRLAIIGGEAAGAEAVLAWHAASLQKDFRVVNTYGPTEAAVAVSFAELKPGGAVTIGKPIGNVGLFPVDAELRAVPQGEIGELLITGYAPGRGYLDEPLRTAERFGDCREGRYYRTGDQGRVREDGLVEFLGRTDDQIKVRGGYRVEPSGVSSELLKHPAVAQAVVLPITSGTDRGMAAFIVFERSEIETSELRVFLKARLPDYMVPNSFVPVSSIPLTNRGKIDRTALLERLNGPPSELSVTTPGSIEDIVRRSWIAATGEEPEDELTDLFFDVGGSSLAAVEFLSHLRSLLGRALPMREFYASPRFGDLVTHLSTGDSAIANEFSPGRESQ
jgi:amino acid adenylation domain-containing protein